MKLILPLDINFPLKTKKDKHVKFSLNDFLCNMSEKPVKANNYYQRKAKEYLQDLVADQLLSYEPLEPPFPKKVVLTIYRGSNRRMDIIDNPVILIKFAMDIVKINHVDDDDFRFFSESVIRDGGLDKENARAELEIVDL